MAGKQIKIDDVKRPEKVTPSASSRPLVVSSHPTLAADPMMASSDAESKTKEDASAGIMSHTAKTIKPLDASLSEVAAEKPSDETPEKTVETGPPKLPIEEASEQTLDTKPKSTPEPKPESIPESEQKPKLTEPAGIPKTTQPDSADAAEPSAVPVTPSASVKVKPASEDRDPDAALTAEETAAVEAKAKREQELEALITSGKYAVPINAVQRKRSRMATLALSVAALLLMLVLLDAIVDVGIVHAPSGIPHTHFFSGQSQ